MLTNVDGLANPKGLRRSLLTASIATLLIANLRLETNTLSLLGLSIIVEQARLVVLGQITVGVFLLLFTLRDATLDVLSRITRYNLRTIERQEKVANDALIHKNGRDPTPEERSLAPDEEHKEVRQEHATRRETENEKFNKVTSLINRVFDSLIRIWLPFILGYVTCTHPYVIANYISHRLGEAPLPPSLFPHLF